MILQFCAKWQFSLPIQQSRELCAFIFGITVFLVVTVIQVILYYHINGIDIGKTTTSLCSSVGRFRFMDKFELQMLFP